MSSDQPRAEELIIGPALSPSITASYGHGEHLVGTKTHISRSRSPPLPESPVSAADSRSPTGDIWLPHSGGGRKPHTGEQTLIYGQTSGIHSVGLTGGNLNYRQDENTPIFSFPSRPGTGTKGLQELKLPNHENASHTGRRTDHFKNSETKDKKRDVPHVIEKVDKPEEFPLTGCEYESDDLAEDISHGLAYGHRKQLTLSSSKRSSNEYPKNTLDESAREEPLVHANNCPHRPLWGEPAPNTTTPEKLSVKDKYYKFKLLGKNGFLTSWRKGPKKFNLEGENPETGTIPRDRHYEGCILCPPQPSPRTSVASTVEDQQLYAPSGQNPGPPPLTPPPSPPGDKDTKGKSPIQAPLLAPTSYNVMRDLLGQHDRVGQPGPSNYQGSSSRLNPYNHHADRESLDEYSLSSDDSGRLNGNSNRIFGQVEEKSNTSSQPLNIRMELSSRGKADSGIDNGPEHDGNKGSQDRNRTKKSRISAFSLGPDPTFLRLSDDMSEGPHPGMRRDHRYLGVDGIFEMVDLDPMPTPTTIPVMTAAPVIHMTLARPSKFSMKNPLKLLKPINPVPIFKLFVRNWKYASLGTVAISSLLSIIILLIFIIPEIMREKADGTTIEVAAFHVSDVTYNYTAVELELVAKSHANTRVHIQPASFTLESDNDYNYDFYHSKKQNSKNRSEVYGDHEYTKLGLLYLSEKLSFSKGNGNIILTSREGDSNHEYGDDNEVRKSGFWRPGDMVEMLVWGQYEDGKGMRSIIQGDIQVRAKGFTATTDIMKKININCMGGFQGIRIDSYRFLHPQKGFIDANITWFNPSVVAMDLGSISFGLFLGDLAIGEAKISSMKIFSGYNHAHFSSILFDRDIFRSNKTLLEDLISALTLEGTRPIRGGLLRLKGRNITVDGTDIDWLQPVIQLFDKDLPVVMNEQIFTTLDTKILLTMTPDGKMKLGRGSNIECNLKLPFESDDFIITVRRVVYFLGISLPLDGTQFLRIESTINSREQSVLSGVHTLNSSLVGSNSSVIEEGILKNIFMPDFIKAQSLQVKVRGSMSVDLDTPYGEARVSEINIENRAWQMKGLHGLDGGGKQRVIISNQMVMGKLWTVTLQIQNPSDMFVNFGDTEFDVFQNNRNGCIGTISVEKLTLDYGSNNITGKFDPTASHCNSSDTAEFLSSFMIGGQNNLGLRTKSHHEVRGLTGLEIQAEWASLGHRLFDSIGLIIGEHKMGARITLKNPFGVVLTLDSVDMELVLAKSGKVITTITSQEHSTETVNGGQSSILSAIPLAPVTSMQELVETFQKELLGETPEPIAITAIGELRLVISDYQTPPVHYVQESVEVKLIWED